MEARDTLMQIALKVFGTKDGIRPVFPSTGEPIQTAMEEAFAAGKAEGELKARAIAEWINKHSFKDEGEPDDIKRFYIESWQAQLKIWFPLKY